MDPALALDREGRPWRGRQRGRRRDAPVARPGGDRPASRCSAWTTRTSSRLELPVYDALYAWAQDQVAARSSG